MHWDRAVRCGGSGPLRGTGVVSGKAPVHGLRAQPGQFGIGAAEEFVEFGVGGGDAEVQGDLVHVCSAFAVCFQAAFGVGRCDLGSLKTVQIRTMSYCSCE